MGRVRAAVWSGLRVGFESQGSLIRSTANGSPPAFVRCQDQDSGRGAQGWQGCRVGGGAGLAGVQSWQACRVKVDVRVGMGLVLWSKPVLRGPAFAVKEQHVNAHWVA